MSKSVEKKFEFQVRKWLEEARSGNGKTPRIEPVIGEGMLYELTDCRVKEYAGIHTVHLTYQHEGETFSLDLSTEMDGPGAFGAMSERELQFCGEGEPGRILRH